MMCFIVTVLSSMIVMAVLMCFVAVIMTMAMTMRFLGCFGSRSAVSIGENSGSSVGSTMLNLSYSPWCKRLGSLFFQSSRWKKALLIATTLDLVFHSGRVVLSIRFFTSYDDRLPTNRTWPTAKATRETPAATPQNGTLGGTTLTMAGMVATYNRCEEYFEAGNQPK